MKCISAEGAKLKIQRVCFCCCLDEETENELVNAIDETQAEDVKRNVYGEWLDCDAISENFEFCNMCGWENDVGARHYNFCPNCGADMRGDKDE